MTRRTRWKTAAAFVAAFVSATTASAEDYQRQAIDGNLPVFAPALKARLAFPLAWTPAVKDLPAWRAAGR